MQYSYCQCSSIQISSDRGQLASHKNSFCCCVYRWNYAVKKLVLTTPKLYCKSKTAVGMLLHYRSTSNELCHPFLKVIVCCGFVRTCIRAHVCVLKVAIHTAVRTSDPAGPSSQVDRFGTWDLESIDPGSLRSSL